MRIVEGEINFFLSLLSGQCRQVRCYWEMGLKLNPCKMSTFGKAKFFFSTSTKFRVAIAALKCNIDPVLDSSAFIFYYIL